MDITNIFQLRFLYGNGEIGFEHIYYFIDLKQLFQFLKNFFKPYLISGVTITKINLWQKDLRNI